MGRVLPGASRGRIYKEDLINYIRLRMQTGSKIRLPDNLLDICYEYRKDLLEFGKKFIHDRGRRQDRNSEAAQDYREAATKLVDKYWQQADDPNVD